MFQPAIWICLSLWWILDKGVANKAPITVGCDSHGITPHHIMCCQSPLLLLPPTPKFPFVTSPLPPPTATALLPLTLQGWGRSMVEHLRKHIWEDRVRVSSFYIHNPMSKNRGTPTFDPGFLRSPANLVRKLGLWFEVPTTFYFTMRGK